MFVLGWFRLCWLYCVYSLIHNFLHGHENLLCFVVEIWEPIPSSPPQPLVMLRLLYSVKIDINQARWASSRICMRTLILMRSYQGHENLNFVVIFYAKIHTEDHIPTVPGLGACSWLSQLRRIGLFHILLRWCCCVTCTNPWDTTVYNVTRVNAKKRIPLSERFNAGK